MPSIHSERFTHWEKIYSTRPFCEMSWYQSSPEQSMALILEIGPSQNDAIIDVGGGDALLAEHLFAAGYRNLSVLDISSTVLERARRRLGEKATSVNWINEDMLEHKQKNAYHIWHDRAAFHFLREEKDIERYVSNVSTALDDNGYLIIGTFADDGPDKCSGIEIRKYSVEELKEVFGTHFDFLKSLSHHHTTPAGKDQHFNFCVFRKKSTI